MSVNIKVRDAQEPFADIFLEKNLDNLYSFKKWLRKNIIIYKDIDEGEVPDEHILIYLNHIESLLVNNNIKEDINRSSWVKGVGKRIMEAKASVRLGRNQDEQG